MSQPTMCEFPKKVDLLEGLEPGEKHCQPKTYKNRQIHTKDPWKGGGQCRGQIFYCFGCRLENHSVECQLGIIIYLYFMLQTRYQSHSKTIPFLMFLVQAFKTLPFVVSKVAKIGPQRLISVGFQLLISNSWNPTEITLEKTCIQPLKHPTFQTEKQPFWNVGNMFLTVVVLPGHMLFCISLLIRHTHIPRTSLSKTHGWTLVVPSFSKVWNYEEYLHLRGSGKKILDLGVSTCVFKCYF